MVKPLNERLTPPYIYSQKYLFVPDVFYIYIKNLSHELENHLSLSIFGLIMSFATVSLIPEKVEPAFWVVIFIFCAYVIAKVCSGNYFWHGFLVSMVNCIWITAVHIWFRETYEVHHPDMASMATDMPKYLAVHPRTAMAVMGPLFGAAFGIVLGVFCLIASRIVKKSPGVHRSKA